MGTMRRGMSRPAEVIPVVERTTKRGFCCLFASTLVPTEDSDDKVLLFTLEIAERMFLVPSQQICRSSTFLKRFVEIDLGPKVGTKPMQDMTMSTNFPSEVRRARRTAGISLIAPVTIVRFDGGSEMERRLRSFSGFRTMTVHW